MELGLGIVKFSQLKTDLFEIFFWGNLHCTKFVQYEEVRMNILVPILVHRDILSKYL